MTVITGANGAGKSTLLNLFSRHFGWDSPYVATPSVGSDGLMSYLPGFLLRRLRVLSSEQEVDVGRLTYSDGTNVPLRVPRKTGHSYHVNIPNQRAVDGLHFMSHRVLSRYQSVGSIPVRGIDPQAAFDAYRNEVHSRYQGSHTQHSPSYRLKEALIAMAMFGEGNSRVQRNDAILRVYDGFIDVLRKLLPPGIGFLDLSIRIPDVVIVTRSGEWSIDAASGGVTALIDLAWQLFLKSQMQAGFVATIDEPENHLHPSMQRSLIRDLVGAFPDVQFIVATHSPFIVTSIKDSAVYALKFTELQSEDSRSFGAVATEQLRVASQLLDAVNKAGSASEVLREVLGVPATIPIWVEQSLAELVARYQGKEFTTALLSELRAELTGLGYGELYPEAIAELTRDR